MVTGTHPPLAATVLLLIIAGAAWGQDSTHAKPAPSALPAPEAIKACLKEARGAAADQDDCFKDSQQYLHTYFEISPADFARECSRYAPDSERCPARTARRPG